MQFYSDKGATPFIRDMRKLGKINHGAKNRYRDEQWDCDAGAKVKKLIDEHIILLVSIHASHRLHSSRY